MNKLTVKQEKAIQEFLINGGNKTAAYKSSYSTSRMTDKSINETACKFFKEIKIASRLNELQKEVEEDNKITKDWIVKQLKNVISKSSQAEVVKDKDGVTGEFKYDSTGVNKAIDTLNKMFSYYAPEKIERVNAEVDKMPDWYKK